MANDRRRFTCFKLTAKKAADLSAQANFNRNSVVPPGCTGDRYIDLNGLEFKGTLTVDSRQCKVT